MTNLSNTKVEAFKTNPYGEQYLYSINRHIFEKESSASVYKRHFAEQFSREDSLYLIFGTDCGLLAKFILEQKIPKNSRFIFIELPHILNQVKQVIPDDYDKETFAFTTPDKWQEVAEAFEITLYIYKDKICYMKSLAAVNSYWVEYHATNLDIIRALESLFFFTRATVGVFPFMARQLMNISENRFSSSLLNELFAGKTCAILGGGPSLDNDIQWLKDNQENIVIIAVSRIAKTLIKQNLIPHIIVSVDPYDVSFDVSKELLQLPEQVLFLQANCVNPYLLSQWHGRSICIGPRFPWSDEEDENCSIMGGPTVTNTALKAAIEMGFSNILLSGVDLCNSQTGVSHASGSNEAKVGPILGQPGVCVETYAGNKAETSIAFDNAVLALSQQANKVKELGVAIYNLSENAARAKHIEHIPTSALSFDQEEDDIWQVINEALPKLTPSLIRKDNNLILKKVSKVLKDIQKIKLLAEEALTCNNKLFKEKGKESENFKYKIRMDKIENKLNNNFKKAAPFVKNFGLDKFIKSAQTSHEDWSDEKVEETGRLYYQAYIDASKTLVKLLQDSVERIKSRIEEEKDAPNFDLIFKQWQQDKHFGRAHVWLKNSNHVSSQLPQSVKSQLDEQIHQFEQVINKDDSAHLARSKQEASLAGVRRKIIILFHQHNIDGLGVLTTSLSTYQGSEEDVIQAKKLHTLAQAFYAVLIGEKATAMGYFEQLDEEEIQEDELQQIASLAIKLEQYDKAEWAFKGLSDLASIYTAQYAKILRLLGKVEQSIDCYTEYLTENSEDIQAWLALGKLYHDIDSVDSAKIAYEYVLAKEPNNFIAQEYLNQFN